MQNSNSNKLKDKNGQTYDMFIKEYDSNIYKKPSITVDIILFSMCEVESNDPRKLNDKKLQLLMLKRDTHPYYDKWCLPGSFLDVNNLIEKTASEILYKKAGIKDVYLEQLYTFDDIDRDPRTRVISSSYMALANQKELNIEQDEFSKKYVKWFDVKLNVLKEERKISRDGYTIMEEAELILDNGVDRIVSKIRAENLITKNEKRQKINVLDTELGFDHAKIIYYALCRLRGKLEYTDIAFSLLEDKFTLSEVQQVYEVILDKKFSKANFQRKIKPMLLPTKENKIGAFRPAKLYKYNQEWRELY